MHLLPAVDILGGKAVRLAKGDYNAVTVYNDDPVAQARIFEEQGADWLHVVDLDGARSGNPDNIAVIEGIMRKALLKVEVGGGIRSIETIKRLADAGVSRIVLGTALVKDPEFAQEAIETFGDLLSAGIDARDGEVAISGWEKGSGISAHDLARKVDALGYRHMVYTDISRDGMQTGLDPEAYRIMAEVFGHPVTASGGVAGLADIEALAPVADSIDGIIAGRAVYEGALNVAEACALCKEATRAALAARIADAPCGPALNITVEGE